MLCIAETHVTHISPIKQFENQIGRKSYIDPATPTVKHYSSGGTAMLIRNHVNTMSIPKELGKTSVCM